MKAETKVVAFATEADLCRAFIAALPEEWTAFPETSGFDILLVRKADGFQIGIEAKLKLNTKVICQAAEPVSKWYVSRSGPDCRAVLIPEQAATELSSVCRFLGLTVITQRDPGDKWRYSRGSEFWPRLPHLNPEFSCDEWTEFAPSHRCHVPDYVPDVIAGDSGPVMLTHWKISAIKISVTLERRGFVTREDFRHFDISFPRWSQGGWLIKGSGGWVRGPYMPDFKGQHPKNYDEIAADFDKWARPDIFKAVDPLAPEQGTYFRGGRL